MSNSAVRCPECQASLKLSAPVAEGKSIRCPKCKKAFRPDANGTSETPVKAAPAASGIKTRPDKSSSAVKAASKSSPRRPANDDDEPPIRTKSRSRQKGPSKALIWGIAGGAVAVVATVVIIIIATSGKKDDEKVVDKDPPRKPPERKQDDDKFPGPGQGGFPGPGQGGFPGPGQGGFPGPGQGGFPGPGQMGFPGPGQMGFPGPGQMGNPGPGQMGFPPPGVMGNPGPGVLGNLGGQMGQPPKPPRQVPPPEEDLGPPVAPQPLPAAKDRPFLTLDAGGHTAMARNVLFTPNGKYAVSVGADKTARVWDIASGETVHIFHVPVGPGDEGALFCADISRDGSRMAIAGFPYGRGTHGMPIYLLELRSGTIERLLLGNESSVSELAFTPDGQRLVSAGNDGTARLFNLRTGQQARVFKGHKDRVAGVAISPDGMVLATASNDKTARTWNINTGAPIAEFKGHKDKLNCVAFTPDGRTLVTGARDYDLGTWDLNGKLRKMIRVTDAVNEPAQITSIHITKNGKEVLFGGIATTGCAGIIDLTTGKKRLDFKAHTNTVTATRYSPDEQLAISHGGDANETFVWRTTDASIVHKLVGKGKAIWAAAWRDDGKAIAWGNTNAGPASRPEHSFLLNDLELAPLKGGLLGAGQSFKNYTLERIDFFKIAIKRDGRLLHAWKSPLDGDRIYSFSSFTGGKAIMGGSFGLYLVDLETGKEVRNYLGHSGIVTSIAPSPDGRLFLTGSADQTLCIFHPDRAEPLMSLFVAGREWIAWTPEGYYSASPYGERLMGWLINNGPDKLASYFPAIRFRASLFQPEAMRKLIRAGSIQRALEVVAKERNKPAQQPTYLANVLPPEVYINTPTAGDVNQAKVEVKAVARSTGNFPVTALRLIVDGRPWKGVKEVRTFDPPKLGEVQGAWTIELPPGKHQLAVLADSSVSRGLSPIVEVNRTGADGDLPNLYVLAMGISAYPGKLKLNYAASDAFLISKSFQERSAGIFKNVQVKIITDADATRKGMVDGLAWLHSVMTERDVAVVSFSGHGARDPLGNFYLVPVDVNPRDPRSLFPGDFFKTALANLPGKVVCLLDACHSGTVAEEEGEIHEGRSDDLVRDLVNDEYGVVVMCSSLGSEYSLESSETKAGFFTLGVVEGLGGKADFNRDSVVYIHELDVYAGLRVQQLSGGLQNPTTGKPPGIRSFPLSRR